MWNSFLLFNALQRMSFIQIQPRKLRKEAKRKITTFYNYSRNNWPYHHQQSLSPSYTKHWKRKSTIAAPRILLPQHRKKIDQWDKANDVTHLSGDSFVLWIFA
ncbi:hypothetical protein ACHAXS_009529 [Conticribra weissflogii]